MKNETWLLVANSSTAKLFKIEKQKNLTELKAFEHPESRLHNIDLVSDRPGRDFESSGTRRHALEQKTSPKKQEFQIFVKELADFLEESQGKFEALYLSASPTILGLLRQSLHPNTLKLVKGETDKDLIGFKAHELPSHLPFFF